MKTLYYEIEIREPQNFFNQGFVKIEKDKEQKIKMFGVLTGDVFIGEEEDGIIKFTYFVRNYYDNSFEETFTFSIQAEDFQLPERFIPEDEYGNELIISIENKIQDRLKKEKYGKIIQDTINVFLKRE